MKICILGPITTKSYFGGVAIFDEGLAKGIKENGCSVFIATDQKDAVENVDQEIPVYVIGKKTFKKIIDKEKPDYIISQLAYAKHLLFTKTDAKKIYFLHAFFKQSYYGVLKSKLAVIYQKILIKNCDLVFSNSYFTQMINNDFFGIKSDAVFHVGVAPELYENIDTKKNIEKQSHSIFFAGRFVPAKGADILINAAKILKDKNIDYHLYIAGDGPEKENLKKIVEENQLPVDFLGRIDQASIIDYYKKAEVFVSLDWSEPFGIVFQEALLCDCKVVCPFTGGQIEILSNLPNSVAFVGAKSPESVASGIENMFEYGIVPKLNEKERTSFTYKAISAKMLAYLSEKYMDSKDK